MFEPIFKEIYSKVNKFQFFPNFFDFRSSLRLSFFLFPKYSDTRAIFMKNRSRPRKGLNFWFVLLFIDLRGFHVLINCFNILHYHFSFDVFFISLLHAKSHCNNFKQ